MIIHIEELYVHILTVKSKLVENFGFKRRGRLDYAHAYFFKTIELWSSFLKEGKIEKRERNKLKIAIFYVSMARQQKKIYTCILKDINPYAPVNHLKGIWQKL